MDDEERRFVARAVRALYDERSIDRVIRRRGELRRQTIGQVEGEIYFVECTAGLGCIVWVRAVRKAHEHEERAYLGGQLGAEAVPRRVGPTGELRRVRLGQVHRKLIAGGYKPDADIAVLTRRELREFKPGTAEAPGVAALRRRLHAFRARLRRSSVSRLRP